MNVRDAVKQRISTRAYLDTPISREEISEWLSDAQRAPSGGNLQPWRVIALTGEPLQDVIDMAAKVLSVSPRGEPTDRPIYPEIISDVQKERRFKVGEMMYDLIGIPREDRAARLQWFARNYRFFEAPVGLFFVVEEHVGHGQWAHTGMFMQTLALLAEERGWGTCMQECWGTLRPSLKEHLGLSETEMVYCGMSVGHPDPDAAVNKLYTERASLEEFAELRGF